MVTLLAMTSGALMTGFGVYKLFTRREGRLLQKSSQKGAKQIHSHPGQESTSADSRVKPWEQMKLQRRTEEVENASFYGLRTSSIALGLATIGLFFHPLQYASIPMLIYMGIPPAQDILTPVVKTRK